MKKILIMAAMSVILCTACAELQQKKQTPEYSPGDMVQTKFGEKVLIIDTMAGCKCAGGFYGEYEVKKKGSSTVEIMPAAEIASRAEE